MNYKVVYVSTKQAVNPFPGSGGITSLSPGNKNIEKVEMTPEGVLVTAKGAKGSLLTFVPMANINEVRFDPKSLEEDHVDGRTA